MACASQYLALFLSLVFVGVICSAADYNILDFKMARRHEQWMSEYRRVYKDEAEKTKRFKIFKRNVEYIEQFNAAGGHSYTLGINLFTDLTSEEFMATYAGNFWLPEDENRPEPHELLNVSLPSSVDWRKQGAVSKIKNQSTCGSCWAFAAAAAIESLVKIKGGPLYDLSTQQLLDCSHGNCRGGFSHMAWDYVIRNPGITTWTNYPYTGSKGSCDSDKTGPDQVVAKISGYKKVDPNEQALMEAVAQQPVVVSVVESKDFQYYKSGVFHGECTFGSRHALVVVGYGEENGDKYWILKNSWSHKWGEDGYMRLQRQGSDTHAGGKCGIAMNAYYPKI